ncbi:MAG: VPLPA-CTERM sorting domain-containing protein [Pseudomonadota bacterium]
MKKLFAIVGLVVGLATGAAQAASIVGGETTVAVTAPLGDLGLGGAPFGTATADGGVFAFPVTGGTSDSSGLLIEHDGSGVTLFTLDINDTSAVTVGNFLIDTAQATVFGDVLGGPSGLDLFSFGTVDSSGIGLNITSTLAGALTDIFGAPDLAGVEFGVANTSPSVVPLPASALLMLGGLGALGVFRMRGRANA